MDNLTNLNYINVFCAAARHKSFSAAAKDLDLTRAAVSKTVAKLEEQLGVTLFIRGVSGLSLTPAGQELYGKASPAISQIINTTHGLAEINSQKAGIVRIGVDGLLAQYFLRKFKDSFSQENPGVFFFISKMQPLQLVSAIENGLVDAGLFCAISRPFEGSEELRQAAKNGGFIQYPLMTGADCLAAGPKYAHLGGSVLSLEQLQEIPLILPLIEFQPSNYYLQLLRKEGQLYPYDLPVSGADSRIALTRYNHGFTYFPEYLLEDEIAAGHLTALRTELPLRSNDFFILVNKTFSISSHAKAFLSFILSQFLDN